MHSSTSLVPRPAPFSAACTTKNGVGQGMRLCLANSGRSHLYTYLPGIAFIADPGQLWGIL